MRINQRIIAPRTRGSAGASPQRGRVGSAALLVFLVALAAASATLLVSCGKRSDTANIKLPATPTVVPQSQWAVVTSEFLRIRDSASLNGTALLTLLRGYEVEIVSRSAEPETVGDLTDYWYYVNYLGLRGWVFGSYLSVYDSKQRADEAAKELH